jgi:hypothetical protein
LEDQTLPDSAIQAFKPPVRLSLLERLAWLSIRSNIHGYFLLCTIEICEAAADEGRVPTDSAFAISGKEPRYEMRGAGEDRVSAPGGRTSDSGYQGPTGCLHRKFILLREAAKAPK